MKTTKLMVFVDAGLASNTDLSSQISQLLSSSMRTTTKHLALVIYKVEDYHEKCTCYRALRPRQRFYTENAIQDTLMQILHWLFALIQKAFITALSSSAPHRKRLMIDLMCLRQAFEHKEINEVKWIDTTANP
jgi:hypothetical protein